MINNSDLRFLTFKYEIILKSIGEMIADIENKVIIIDPAVQRKLSKSRTNEIAEYLQEALDGKRNGAYFEPILGSKRKDGTIIALLNGQHRFFGSWNALNQIRAKIDQLMKDDNPDVEQIEKLREHETIIENSVLPMMCYVGLTLEQEQQMFYDTNNLGKKVPKSLSLSFNHSDPLVSIARIVSRDEKIEPFVQPLQEGTKLKDGYLFTFSTVYTTVSAFCGKNKIAEVDMETLETEILDFFEIIVDSFPEDILSDKYLYKHAGVLPGIASFTNRMKNIPGVCWRNTLKNALSNVSFSKENVQFVRFGRAHLDSANQVVFSGSKGAISAVVKTLEQVALRLDESGNEVLEAYQQNDEQPIIVVSEEAAERAAEEAAIADSHEEHASKTSNQNDNEQSLSASEKAILRALDESHEKSLTGSFTEIAEALNFARSTITEALKKLERKQMITITDNNGIKTITRTTKEL